jgi:hypothetical protein
MSSRSAAKWASPVVSRSVVTAPGRVLRVVRVVSSAQQKDSVARALAAARDARAAEK